MSELIIFPAADGVALSGTLYRPEGAPSSALLMSAGTAYPQRIMAKLAAWAAERGALVLTYDYRGIGRLRHSCRLTQTGTSSIGAGMI